MRLRLFSLTVLSTAIMIVAGVQTSCSRGESSLHAESRNQVAEAPIVPVARIGRAQMSNKTVLTAEFQPFQEVEVMAKVAGYVRVINVDLGDRVREGQVLGELEIPEMNDEVSKATAMVEQTSSEIAAARDELQRVESSHQITHLSYRRLQEVAGREPGLIPQQELDEARSRDLVAEAQLAAAQSKLRVEQNKTLVAKAEETRLRTMNNYLTISAPFAGTVTRRYANIGSMLQAGTASQAMPLVRLSQLSTLRLTLPVPESLVPAIRVGKPTDVHVKSLARSFEGRIARFASKVDPQTRTMATEVDVSNPTGVILPGMYAEVALETTQRANVLAAPVDAIERAGSTTRVWTVDTSGIVAMAPVQLGIEDARRVEIVSGVRESDLVITGKRAGLKAGDKVVAKIVTYE